uniref:Cyclin-A2 n=1 Tax=Apteryx owenii TaxID=8824 RepID=A0A8B9S3J6_APTOW
MALPFFLGQGGRRGGRADGGQRDPWQPALRRYPGAARAFAFTAAAAAPGLRGRRGRSTAVRGGSARALPIRWSHAAVTGGPIGVRGRKPKAQGAAAPRRKRQGCIRGRRHRLPAVARRRSPSVMDISISSDAEERSLNVNNVPDYVSDIHTYLREMEVKCKPKMGYMKKQPDITNNMRAILVDWLVEVGEEYKLQNETLHLAVNYIDRFLSSMSVLRGKLQLVGTAAMLLASKFEEIYPPEVAEFVYITDDTYTKKQVLRMEHLILKVLSFDLAAPTINQFLTQYFLHEQTSAKVESLSMYLGELSLIDADPYLKYLPSVIAAAAFHLAGYTITGQTWPESLCKVTGYTLENIKPCLMDLHRTYLKAAQHTQQSIREKYKSTK